MEDPDEWPDPTPPTQHVWTEACAAPMVTTSLSVFSGVEHLELTPAQAKAEEKRRRESRWDVCGWGFR